MTMVFTFAIGVNNIVLLEQRERLSFSYRINLITEMKTKQYEPSLSLLTPHFIFKLSTDLIQVSDVILFASFKVHVWNYSCI